MIFFLILKTYQNSSILFTLFLHIFYWQFFPLSQSREFPSIREKPGGYWALLRLAGGVPWLKTTILKQDINQRLNFYLLMKQIQNFPWEMCLPGWVQAPGGASYETSVTPKSTCLYPPASAGINCFFCRDYSIFSMIRLIFQFHPFLT